VPEEDFVQVPLVWVGLDDLPIHLVNQFTGQFQELEVIVNVGQIAPPVIMGNTPQERREQARHLSFVPVRPVARLGMTVQRLRELIEVLQMTLANYEEWASRES
jgi:hypothetical protein